MPASCRASPAGCIFGLSLAEPMMIPTSGASTSISSNASSTAGIVAVAGPSLSANPDSGAPSSGSYISISLPSLAFRGEALNRARRDVGAHLHSVEADPAGSIVRLLAGIRRGGAETGDVQHPAPRGHDLAVAPGGARVQHLGDRGRIIEPGDHVLLRGRLRVTGRCEHHRHRPVV